MLISSSIFLFSDRNPLQLAYMHLLSSNKMLSLPSSQVITSCKQEVWWDFCLNQSVSLIWPYYGLYHSAGAPGMPLPAEGTITAFLSSVRVKRHSRSCASLSMSSSVFSAQNMHALNISFTLFHLQSVNCCNCELGSETVVKTCAYNYFAYQSTYFYLLC